MVNTITSSSMTSPTFTINSHITPSSKPLLLIQSPKTTTKYSLDSSKGINFILLPTHFQLPTNSTFTIIYEHQSHNSPPKKKSITVTSLAVNHHIYAGVSKLISKKLLRILELHWGWGVTIKLSYGTPNSSYGHFLVAFIVIWSL